MVSLTFTQFGDRIQRLRKENNLTIDEFVEEMNRRFDSNLNKSIVSRYENNIHKPQRFSLIQEIADFYGVTIDYLIGRTNNKYENIGKNAYKEIPILGTVAAGIPILAQENLEGYEAVPEDLLVDYGLNVKGNSMINARILDGDTVFIRQQSDVNNGDIAVVLIDREEVTLKRVYKMNGTVILRAENPEFEDRVFSKKDSKNVQILGKAVYFSSKVR